jgi:hypothetical protein
VARRPPHPRVPWNEHGDHVAASSSDAAIRAHANRFAKPQDAAGTYVAVPSRSWKPTPVEVDTVTTVKLGEAVTA